MDRSVYVTLPKAIFTDETWEIKSHEAEAQSLRF